MRTLSSALVVACTISLLVGATASAKGDFAVRALRVRSAKKAYIFKEMRMDGSITARENAQRQTDGYGVIGVSRDLSSHGKPAPIWKEWVAAWRQVRAEKAGERAAHTEPVFIEPISAPVVRRGVIKQTADGIVGVVTHRSHHEAITLKETVVKGKRLREIWAEVPSREVLSAYAQGKRNFPVFQPFGWHNFKQGKITPSQRRVDSVRIKRVYEVAPDGTLLQLEQRWFKVDSKTGRASAVEANAVAEGDRAAAEMAFSSRTRSAVFGDDGAGMWGDLDNVDGLRASDGIGAFHQKIERHFARQ